MRRGATVREAAKGMPPELAAWMVHAAARWETTAKGSPYPATPAHIERGQFHISEVESTPPSPTSVAKNSQASSIWITASVGNVSWNLLPSTHALRLGELSFAFHVEGSQGVPATELVLLFPSTTPAEDIGVLEAILDTVCQYAESERAEKDGEIQAAEAVAADALQAAVPAMPALPAKVVEQPAPSIYVSPFAKNVERAAQAASAGIASGALWAADSLKNLSQRFSEGQPTEQPVHLPRVATYSAKTGAGAARMAARVANGLAGGVAWVGTKLAGGVLWATGMSRPLSPTEQPGAYRETTHAAAMGAATVWEAVEAAGYLVLTTARDNAVSTAKHRYGSDAAEVTRHGMDAVGYAGDAASAVSARAIARKAARRTARQVLRRAAT